MTTQRYKVDQLHGWQAFADLRPEWHVLAERNQSPLVTHEWLAAARNTSNGDDVVVVTVRDGPTLVAAALLREQRDGFGFVQRFELVDQFAHEPTQFPHTDDAAYATLLCALLNLNRPLALPCLPAQLADNCLHKARRRSLILRRSARITAYVDLSDDAMTFEARMSGSRRGALRRKAKAMQRAGTVHFEAFTPSVDDLPSLLAEIQRVESSGWKGRSGTSIVDDQRMGRFVDAWARSFAERGMLRVFFLSLDRKVIAVRLNASAGDTLFELKIGYDESYAHLAPGIVLMHEILCHSCEVGLKRYEFLGSYESWQDYWPHKKREHISLRSYPLRPSSISALMADGFARLKNR